MKIENWIEIQLEQLESRTRNYTNKEKKSIGYNDIKSALYLVPTKISDDSELHEFKTKLELVIDAVPIKKDGDKIDYGTFGSSLSNFKKAIRKKYNIVNKGVYISQGIALGMPLGLLLGLLLDNLAFGLPMGTMIGLIIGSALEGKAKKENRILN